MFSEEQLARFRAMFSDAETPKWRELLSQFHATGRLMCRLPPVVSSRLSPTNSVEMFVTLDSLSTEVPVPKELALVKMKSRQYGEFSNQDKFYLDWSTGVGFGKVLYSHWERPNRSRKDQETTHHKFYDPKRTPKTVNLFMEKLLKRAI